MLKDEVGGVGILGWCANYEVPTTGCDVKKGYCLCAMAGFLGRMLDKEDPEKLTDAELMRAHTNANLMERLARELRDVVDWIEDGHNGHRSSGNANLLTQGLRRVARAKPDAGSTICGGICVLGAATMVEDGITSGQGITQAIGALELKRILKAAAILQENADNIRAAVVRG
jgi:hypothetical protein